MPSFRELYKCVNHPNYVRNGLIVQSDIVLVLF
jgi:isoprenylcysteine carboxyl methyltransferase (ICMT) family protein YpbQ